MSNIKDIAEKILGRKLDASEGISNDAIASAESKLGVTLPADLREFYQTVGKINLFTDAFEFFAKPKQIYIKANKLIFLEENQAVLSWGLDLNSLKKKDITVYQSPNAGDPDNEVVWYAESLSLTKFLEMIMYYQVASGDSDLQNSTKGGYPFGFAAYKSDLDAKYRWDSFEQELSERWEKVVDNNGLMIYWREGAILLYYTVVDLDTDVDDLIYVSTKRADSLADFRNKFGFEEAK